MYLVASAFLSNMANLVYKSSRYFMNFKKVGFTFLIVLFLFSPELAQSKTKAGLILFENNTLGVILVVNPEHNYVEGALLNKKSWAPFKGTRTNDVINASIPLGKKSVPVYMKVSRSSLFLLVNNSKKYYAKLITNPKKATMFPPEVLNRAFPTYNLNSSNSGKSTYPNYNLNSSNSGMSRYTNKRKNSFIIGKWASSSSFRSKYANVYGSSVHVYQFFPDGTFTYDRQSEISAKGTSRRRPSHYSGGTNKKDGGRWEIRGDHLIFKWNNGKTVSRFFAYFDNKNHEQIQLGKGKSLSLISKIYK